MKKTLLHFLLFALPAVGFSQTAFTPGNLVITRVGSGTTSLSSKAAPVSLLELNSSGTVVQTIDIPYVASMLSGNNKLLTVQGSSSNDGNLTRSANGGFFILTGYACDTTVTSPAAASAPRLFRTIARIGMNGVVNTSTLIDTIRATSNSRCATSVDGSGFWQVGASGGVRYAPFGSTGVGNDTSVVVSSTISNLRSIQTFGGDLIIGNASGTIGRVAKITGTPTTTGNAMVGLPGLSTTIAANSIFMTSLPGGPAGLNTMYVADDGTVAGIKKFALNASTNNWDSVGIYDAGGAYRGLAASVNGSTVTIYAVKASTPVLRFIDAAGYGVAPTPKVAPYDTVYKAATNTAVRGLGIATSGVTPVQLLSFNAARNENGKVKTWWVVANEVNLNNYVVEKSYDNRSFATIGAVAAAGKENYEFTDNENLTKTSFYRIRVNDKDGKFAYSNVVVVKPAANIKLEAFPNPVKDKVAVTYPATRIVAGIAVTTMDGKTVQTVALPIGSTQTMIDMSGLSKGNYVLIFTDADGNRSTTKLVKE